MDKILRGSLWWADLGEDAEGCEQLKTRPVIVIQNNVGNEFSPTVIVAALTFVEKRYMPTHAPIHMYEVPGLTKTSVAMLEQIRTIDKRRLQQYIGQAPERVMRMVDKALAISVGLAPVPVRRTDSGKEVESLEG